MTVLEQKKFRLIRAIMDEPDGNRLSEVERFYEGLSKPSFMCSLDELRESLIQQQKDVKAGKVQFIPHDQMKRKTMP